MCAGDEDMIPWLGIMQPGLGTAAQGQGQGECVIPGGWPVNIAVEQSLHNSPPLMSSAGEAADDEPFSPTLSSAFFEGVSPSVIRSSELFGLAMLECSASVTLPYRLRRSFVRRAF